MSAAPPSGDPTTEPGIWNAVAAAYDEEFFTRTPELVARALEILAPASGARVLDVGTGPGALAIALARRGARVTAVDFAASMIDRLRAHLQAEQVTNVEAGVMDGQALALPDGSFDQVASLFGWFLFADRAAGLAEFRRVLRPGGQLLVTSWSGGERNTMFAAGMKALREAVPDLPRPPGPLPTQQPEVCAGELRAAGFEEVSAEVLDVPARIDTVETFWAMFERAAVPVVLLKQKLGERWPAVNEGVLRALRREFGAGPMNLTISAIYTSGRRGV